MKRFILVLPLLLMACNTQTKILPGTDVMVYPNLPDVEPLPALDLRPVIFDYPRDTSKYVVRDITDCRNVPVARQDNAYKTKCLLHPVVPNSNIFIGLDQDNATKLQLNLNTLNQREQQWKARVDAVNNERAEWRKKNEEANKGK